MRWLRRRDVRAKLSELEERIELLEALLSSAQRRERQTIAQALQVVAIARAEGMLPEASDAQA